MHLPGQRLHREEILQPLARHPGQAVARCQTSHCSHVGRHAAIGDADLRDGLVAAFSKTFQDENLAVETKFRVAESYFELFKSHKSLDREVEAIAVGAMQAA